MAARGRLAGLLGPIRRAGLCFGSIATVLLAGCGSHPVPSADAVGPVDRCRRGPAFQSELALGPRSALSTSLTEIKGLVIIDPDGADGVGSVYQHESWDDAGYLGPFVTDRRGDVYVAPVPLVSLIDNPAGMQNRVYRIDSDSREMSLFLELPAAANASERSVFGVVGLAYDCETHSLYASSLAGSTLEAEVGRIFRLDLAAGRIASRLEGVDCLGVGVHRGSNGKRLYCGSARGPLVQSWALDASGDAVGDARLDLPLGQQVSGGRNTVRRIRFTTDGRMELRLFEFRYSLHVSGERIEDVLLFDYDPGRDRWSFVAVAPPG